MSQSKPLNRREFIKTIGLTTASALTVPLSRSWKSSGSSLSENMSLRVGAVIPTYLKNRRLAASWLKGLRFGLSQEAGITLIPFAADDRVLSVANTMNELIRVSQADLLVGSVSPFGSTRVAAALENSSAVFVNSEVGANLVFPSQKFHNIFHHSLHYWQANWAAGEWAAQSLGKRGVIVATMYEAGFDALAAFQLAFEQAGGKILHTAITHSPTQPRTVQETFAGLAGYKPDFVYLMASGNEAEELKLAFEASPLFGRTSLAGSGFALANGIRNTELHDLALAYRLASGEALNAMALLGYETGLLILTARQEVTRHGISLIQALSNASIESPRGKINMASQTTLPAMFVDQSAKLLTHLGSVDPASALVHPGWSNVRTGWITPYFGL